MPDNGQSAMCPSREDLLQKAIYTATKTEGWGHQPAPSDKDSDRIMILDSPPKNHPLSLTTPASCGSGSKESHVGSLTPQPPRRQLAKALSKTWRGRAATLPNCSCSKNQPQAGSSPHAKRASGRAGQRPKPSVFCSHILLSAAGPLGMGIMPISHCQAVGTDV